MDIDDRWTRGNTLLKVLRRGPKDQSAVAEVLTLTDWTAAIPEVVASTPDALDQIFGELNRIYGPSLDVRGDVEQE